MHRYFIKTPWWLRRIFSGYIWKLPAIDKTIYLTFDDGPHPQITDWVLDELKKYHMSATFFCIGKNVELYPEVFKRIVNEGHATGNHTYAHANGWKTPASDYLREVKQAAALIPSRLFRPPYGRIRKEQAAGIAGAMGETRAKVIMWDVLSGDFDKEFTPKQCFEHVRKNIEPGSIIVFHDSEKAYGNLKEVLPAVLEWMRKEGYISKKIEV
jgi:peptidoglycan/xylan/chitin deacetylase (PgdA/CDA1 family)